MVKQLPICIDNELIHLSPSESSDNLDFTQIDAPNILNSPVSPIGTETYNFIEWIDKIPPNSPTGTKTYQHPYLTSNCLYDRKIINEDFASSLRSSFLSMIKSLSDLHYYLTLALFAILSLVCGQLQTFLKIACLAALFAEISFRSTSKELNLVNSKLICQTPIIFATIMIMPFSTEFIYRILLRSFISDYLSNILTMWLTSLIFSFTTVIANIILIKMGHSVNLIKISFDLISYLFLGIILYELENFWLSTLFHSSYLAVYFGIIKFLVDNSKENLNITFAHPCVKFINSQNLCLCVLLILGSIVNMDSVFGQILVLSILSVSIQSHNIGNFSRTIGNFSRTDFDQIFYCAMVFIAPIFEEFVFRILLSSYINKWMSVIQTKYIVCSLFSLAHGSNTVLLVLSKMNIWNIVKSIAVQMTCTFFLGLILYDLPNYFYMTLFHMIYNSMGLYLYALSH
jgi:membrane protease YdiL (CAAX protease family)